MKYLKFIYLIILLFLVCCKDKPKNYLIDELPQLLIESSIDKRQLKKFKNMPFESAVLKYSNSESFIFTKIEEILKDSIKSNLYIKSLSELNVSFADQSLPFLFVGAFYNRINKDKMSFDELYYRTDQIYSKRIVLDSKKPLILKKENSCYEEIIKTIDKRIDEQSNLLDYLDADLLIHASTEDCLNDPDNYRMYSKVLLKYFELHSNKIIELLDEKIYTKDKLLKICKILSNNKYNSVTLKKILSQVTKLKSSETKNNLILSFK